MTSAETFRAFGEQLRAARIEQKRSLEEVAAALKINRRHLEAIEGGDLARLPQGPYVAAFLREYARVLGLAVPPEYAPAHPAPVASPRDPKVVSHPARHGEENSLSQIARDTARFANTAVKGAVKTVTKTTESVVNLVETGSKEALDMLTSKELWEEAENIRRERHGLPPLERAAKPAPEPHEQKAAVSAVPVSSESETASMNSADAPPLGSIPQVPVARGSRKTTNIVIVALAIIFAGVAYLAIRTSHQQAAQTAAIPSHDYVPAPMESTPPPPIRKHAAPKPVTPVASLAEPANLDSLRFRLRATEPVWVSIAPDGVPAYRGQMRAGEVHSFRAAKKFVIDIGNQKSVAMTFEGKRLLRLPAVEHSKVVVRNLVLTRTHATEGASSVDIQDLTAAGHPQIPPGVPPPAIAKKMEDLAKHARERKAAELAKGTSGSTTHAVRERHTRAKREKASRVPSEPIREVKPIPPGP